MLQTLVGINVHLENLSRESRLDPSNFRLKIARTQKLVSDSVNAIHHFARELRPTVLDDLGVLPALRSCLADFRRRTSVRVQFTSFPEVEKLNNARHTVIYRVVQSAIANIAQHAGASRVAVSIQDGGATVHLKIHDNGRSFDVERTLHTKRYNRMGLLGMRERVEMVGGVFAIESVRGRGTTIRAEIPIADFDEGKRRQSAPHAQR